MRGAIPPIPNTSSCCGKHRDLTFYVDDISGDKYVYKALNFDSYVIWYAGVTLTKTVPMLRVKYF
jgi:hypothetical protein